MTPPRTILAKLLRPTLLGLMVAAAVWAQDDDFSAGLTDLGASHYAARPAVAVQPQVGEYPLAAGDTLRITVVGESDMSGEFDIAADGTLDLPMVGHVQAAGQTPQQVQKAYAQALAQGYLVNPQVRVAVINQRPFYILGEVNRPGSYPCARGLTVIGAIAMAGGYSPRAAVNEVWVRHATDPAQREEKTSENASVLPGDVLRVEERFF